MANCSQDSHYFPCFHNEKPKHKYRGGKKRKKERKKRKNTTYMNKLTDQKIVYEQTN